MAQDTPDHRDATAEYLPRLHRHRGGPSDDVGIILPSRAARACGDIDAPPGLHISIETDCRQVTPGLALPAEASGPIQPTISLEAL